MVFDPFLKLSDALFEDGFSSQSRYNILRVASYGLTPYDFDYTISIFGKKLLIGHLFFTIEFYKFLGDRPLYSLNARPCKSEE